MNQRVAVVTGAASGIGSAIALGFARDGYAVAVADLDPEGGQRIAEEVRQAGGTAEPFVVDVSDPASALALASSVQDRLAPANVLVNCAGWDEIMRFSETDHPLWTKVIAINLFGVVSVCHAFLDQIQSQEGRFVNVASDAGRVGSSGETVYSGAKAGVIGFTKSLAREVARFKATANCVCPGPTKTPFLYKNPPKLLEALERAIPMRRFGEPEDIWPAIRFFASPEASYITGQVISVSGGLTMSG